MSLPLHPHLQCLSPDSPPLIPYARQSISKEDIQTVADVLQSDWITQGPLIDLFERRVAQFCGAAYAVAVANGTAALHLACLALNLKPGDRLWTSPNTFVASANCALYCSAKPDFVDINPLTYNLDPEYLEKKLAAAHKNRTLPKIIVPVHFAGQPCDMEPIARLARKFDALLLEDAAHALGATYQSKPVGNGQFSDLTILSFHPVKIITTAEGGMLLTNRKDLYDKLIRLRSHGITRDPALMHGPSHGPWYYQQIELGFNYRMTDLQAALGVSQMNRLDLFLARRRFLAQRYNQLLHHLPLVLPWQHPQTNSSWHLYVVRLKLDQIRKTHRQVFEQLRHAGIGVNLHYIPVPTQPYYRQLGFKPGDFPQAERYYAEAISLPMFYELTEHDQDRVAAAFTSILTG